MLKILEYITRRQKRFFFWLTDTLFVPMALYMAFALRYGTLQPMGFTGGSWVLFPITIVAGGGLVYAFRLQQIKLQTFESRAILLIGLTAISLIFFVMVSSYVLGLSTPRSVPLIFGNLFFLASVLMRVVGLYVLTATADFLGKNRVTVAIYGAGAAGILMAAALRQAPRTRPVLFVDENPALCGLIISGLPVHSPAKLDALIARHKIERVLIAIPSASHSRNKELVRRLSELPVEVKILPSFIDMMAGIFSSDTLRPVSPYELLGRDKVTLDTPEIARAYAGRVVMVTGAGA